MGARWLSELCHRAQTGAGPTGSSDDALALAVSRILLASKSADEAAAELFDLMGDGSFDAIQQLLEHRYLHDFLLSLILSHLLACDDGGQVVSLLAMTARVAHVLISV